MPRYLITMPMTAYLVVDCKNESEAHEWQKKIVATLEDENGNPIPPGMIEDFEAECYLDDITIELQEVDSN